MPLVLVADDSPLCRNRWQDALEERDFAVRTDENGLDAYLRWRDGQNAYDCLITDLNMPEMDGFELIRQIRNKPGGTKLPIIVTTVRKRKSDVKKAIEYGADDYIVKDPVNEERLVKKVRNQLSEYAE